MILPDPSVGIPKENYKTDPSFVFLKQKLNGRIRLSGERTDRLFFIFLPAYQTVPVLRHPVSGISENPGDDHQSCNKINIIREDKMDKYLPETACMIMARVRTHCKGQQE